MTGSDDLICILFLSSALLPLPSSNILLNCDCHLSLCSLCTLFSAPCGLPFLVQW